MSLYDDSNPQHLDYLQSHRAVSEHYNSLPKWRIELHNDTRSVHIARARNIDDAHRFAEQEYSKRLFVRQSFEFGATISRVQT